jgi:hypothetical protein
MDGNGATEQRIKRQNNKTNDAERSVAKIVFRAISVIEWEIVLLTSARIFFRFNQSPHLTSLFVL